VSKSVSAFILSGNGVREQRCLIAKTITLQNFEQFSQKIQVFILGHRHLGEPNAAEKFKILKIPSAVVFEGKAGREQLC
jgi:hypothetical protein